jgi:hypothetical protein
MHHEMDLKYVHVFLFIHALFCQNVHILIICEHIALEQREFWTLVSFTELVICVA